MDLLTRWRRGWILLGALAWLAGCAHAEGSGEGRTASASDGADAGAGASTNDRDADSGSDAEAPPPRVVSTDRAVARDAGAGTSARSASARVVEEGKGYLIARQPDAAARRFLRATQVDPTNGFAWYYLGRARADAGDARGAVGVLEKAESLLGPYPAWQGRATRLLAELRAR
ncbi:MAG: tetratricopeptide repeat protein [Gemmatimonadota bacterium]